MSKKVLLGIGILIVLMGVWGILSNYYPKIANVYDPLWHGIFKLIAGTFCIAVALKDKKS
jgi:uncharacterized membrane protein HdeD (DUF308 family)